MTHQPSPELEFIPFIVVLPPNQCLDFLTNNSRDVQPLSLLSAALAFDCTVNERQVKKFRLGARRPSDVEDRNAIFP